MATGRLGLGFQIGRPLRPVFEPPTMATSASPAALPVTLVHVWIEDPKMELMIPQNNVRQPRPQQDRTAGIAHRSRGGIGVQMMPTVGKCRDGGEQVQTTMTLVAQAIAPAVICGSVKVAFFPAKSASTTPRAVAQALQTKMGILCSTTLAIAWLSGGQPTGVTFAATGVRIRTVASPASSIRTS